MGDIKMTVKTQEISPCPWCDSIDVCWAQIYGPRNWSVVQCVDCGARGPTANIDDLNGAIELWNTMLDKSDYEYPWREI